MSNAAVTATPATVGATAADATIAALAFIALAAHTTILLVTPITADVPSAAFAAAAPLGALTLLLFLLPSLALPCSRCVRGASMNKEFESRQHLSLESACYGAHAKAAFIPAAESNTTLGETQTVSSEAYAHQLFQADLASRWCAVRRTTSTAQCRPHVPVDPPDIHHYFEQHGKRARVNLPPACAGALQPKRRRLFSQATYLPYLSRAASQWQTVLRELDLTENELNEDNVKRQFRHKSLDLPVDADNGTQQGMATLRIAYDRVLALLAMHRKGRNSLLQRSPIHHPEYTARPWHGSEANKEISATISWSLGLLSPFLLAPVEEVKASLTNLQAGSHYAVPLRVRSVSVPWPNRTRQAFHGTGWSRVQSILERGFLPSFGAGRHSALAKFGVDLPVLYVTPLLSTAERYPQLLVDKCGTPCGEIIAWDMIPVRIVFSFFLDVAARRIKIRRDPGNKQDGYLTEDTTLDSIIFIGKLPTQRQVDQYSARTTRYIPPQILQPDSDEAKHLRLQREALRTVSYLRTTTPRDLRGINELRDATLQLLDVRADFLLDLGASSNHCLSNDDMKLIWKTLRSAYEAEEDAMSKYSEETHWSKGTDHHKSHSRFRLWIRLIFGEVTQIRELLRNGLPTHITTAVKELDEFED